MEWKDGKKRCRWVNPKNEIYLRYHDEEWGVPVHDDHQLFEMLILESFQAGLSWECVLNKREAFRAAFDGFDLAKVCDYDEEKMAALRENPGIIRNKLKIRAAVKGIRKFFQLSLALDLRNCFARNRCGKFSTFRSDLKGFAKTRNEVCRNGDYLFVLAGGRRH